MELGKYYLRDLFFKSFAASYNLTEQEVDAAIEGIPSNIVEKSIDANGNRIIRKIRVPMP